MIVILLALLPLALGFKLNSQRKFGSRNLDGYAFLSDDAASLSPSVLKMWPGRSVPVSEPSSHLDTPSSGLIEYKGDTSKVNGDGPRWATDELCFVPPSRAEQFWTRFNLWKQWPWKKIRGKVVLKAKIGGALPLEPTPKGFAFGAVPDLGEAKWSKHAGDPNYNLLNECCQAMNSPNPAAIDHLFRERPDVNGI
jgi:hypothetical protein